MSTHASRALRYIAFGATFLALVPAAHAGGFDVHACNSAIAGGANNALVAVADNGTTAYNSCPAGQGIVVRNVYDNGQSGWLQGAYMIYDAVPGTWIDSISFQAGWRRHSCTWSTAIVASGSDLGGNIIWGYPANQLCDSGQIPSDTDFWPTRFDVPVNNSRVRIESRCGAASCPRDGVATMRLKDVVIHIRDDIAPTLNNGRGALWTADGWLAGSQKIGVDAADAAGISGTSVSVDGNSQTIRAFPCDFTRRAPCGAGSLDTTLATSAWADGDHTLTLAATDAAGDTTTASRTIHVDNTPPDPPRNVTVEGGEAWRSANDFALHWGLAPVKVGAPVAGAEWELCPQPQGPCTRGAKDGTDISSLSRFRVPAPGSYLLRIWLRDSAGNHDPRLAAPPVQLRVDDSNPELAFEPLSPDDPTRVIVRTSDKGSGVATGQISIRARGATDWTPLATTLEDSRLVARLDDRKLGDGTYELSATATDQAGNQRSAQQRFDGQPALVTMPVRLKTSLRAGVVRRHRSGLARAATVRYGQLVRVRGRLTSSPGNPMQGVTVQAFTQIVDGSAAERLIAAVTTSRTGRFTFLVRRGPSRKIRIEYGGAPQIRSATSNLELLVRSSTTIRPNRRRFSNGETVTFRGRIKTGRIPPTGKLVLLEVNARGKWRPFETARAGRDGRWHRSYRFDGTRGRVTYRFRAKVLREAGYPFAPGRSRTVRIRVNGA